MPQAQLERLIPSAEQGSASSSEHPLAVLCGELRRLPQRELCRNRSLTMRPTTLVHETCLNSRAAADRGGSHPRALLCVRLARHAAPTHRVPVQPPRIRLQRFPRNLDPAAAVGVTRKN
jgi:hypothetical protein